MIDDDLINMNINETDPGMTRSARDIDKEGREKRALNRRLDKIAEGQDQAKELKQHEMKLNYHMDVAKLRHQQVSMRSPVRTISTQDVLRAKRRGRRR